VDNVLEFLVVGRTGKDITRPLDHRPYGAAALNKKFFFESRAALKASAISLRASSFRSSHDFPFPALSVDGSWFTGGLKAVDQTETLTAEIRK
jgi:hypothetical protein